MRLWPVRCCTTTLWSCAGFFLLALQANADPLYTVTDLGSNIKVSGLNDLGQVVGSSQLPDLSYYGVLYNSYGPNAGKILDISGIGTTADAINNNGQVLLNSAYPDNANPGLWIYSIADGTKTEVGTTLNGSSAQMHGVAMNNQGQVTGFGAAQSSDPAQTGVVTHTFLSTNGQAIDLGALPGGTFSLPSAINNQGQVVGSSSLDNLSGFNSFHAFLSSNGKMIDLGTLGGQGSSAMAINDSGQIVGASSLTSNIYGLVHAFLYQTGVMHDLGTLGGTSSWAYGINNAGQIVGTSDTTQTSAGAGSTQVQHGFLYENGKMLDLNQAIPAGSGWTINSALAINTIGQILGTGTGPDGSSHEFLLTPSELPAPGTANFTLTAVPEPSTFAFIAITVTALGVRRALRRADTDAQIPTICKRS
jgi:probable HAF family extracellular repeat protein